MRAALVREFGPISGLVVEDVADLTPGPGEVVVEVAAFSINYPDILYVEGTYQTLPDLPFSPGKDAAGRVLAVGEGVERLQVGQRVLALVEYGAYAEQLLVPEDLVVEVPEQVSFESAAASGLVFYTAQLGLMQRGQLKAGETVLVTGVGGGVGSAAVQLAKAHGARVVALTHDERRAGLARSLGADVALTSSPETLREDVLNATDGGGVDVVLDVLGGEYLAQIVRATAWEGRIVLAGFAAGGPAPIKPGHLLVRNISAVGLGSSDYRDRNPQQMRATMAEVLELFGAGTLNATIDTVFTLDEVGRALQYVKDGGVQGKVVVKTTTGG